VWVKQVCNKIVLEHLFDTSIERIIAILLESMVLRSRDNGTQLIALLDHLPAFEQRNVVTAVLQNLAKEHLSSEVTTEANSLWWKADSKLVSGAASVVKLLVDGSELRRNFISGWTTSSTGAGVGEGIPIRRAVLAVLADDKNVVETIFEKSIAQFGDQLYIKHTPTIQQEGTQSSLVIHVLKLTMPSPHSSSTSLCRLRT
jgi:telomere length regulation protein